MKNTKDERLLDALDYIDEAFVGETEKYYRPKKTVSSRLAKRNRWLAVGVALAACAVLFALAIPTTTTIVRNIDLFRPVGADGVSGLIEKSPEYDGSRGLLYEVNEDGESATFIGYGSCTDETVYIASTYNGLPVTRMYNKGYWDATYIAADHNFNSKYLKHLVISDTVKTVDLECIRQCPNIESVYYGASVERIRALPFNGGYGKNFTTVEVSPDNPYYSDKGNCIVDLRTKTLVLATPTTVIPDDGSVEIIGRMAFGPARSVASVVIPEGVKIIDNHAFMGCMELASVTLPDSLEIIELGAFSGCKSLKTLTLGTNLKVFSQLVFQKGYCPQLYYKGTVAQWEAVIKTRGANNGTYFISIPVICSDGESPSDAGVKGNYNWRHDPQYKWYWEREYPGEPFPENGPWNTDPLLYPSETSGQ